MTLPLAAAPDEERRVRKDGARVAFCYSRRGRKKKIFLRRAEARQMLPLGASGGRRQAMFPPPPPRKVAVSRPPVLLLLHMLFLLVVLVARQRRHKETRRQLVLRPARGERLNRRLPGFENRAVDLCMQDAKREIHGEELAGDICAIRRLRTRSQG